MLLTFIITSVLVTGPAILAVVEFFYRNQLSAKEGKPEKCLQKEKRRSTSTKQFVWIPGDPQPSEERDCSNAITKRFYSEGEQIGGASYNYAKDHLGSIRELTNGSGTVQTRYDYDPFGRRTKVSGGVDADFGFTGHYYHQPSGLHLALYRAYDADLGRWISRDPIAEEAGLNLYRYVFNNPTRLTDMFGLLVDAYFNVYQGLLTVVDRESGARITLPANSGIQGTTMNNNPDYELRQGGPIPRADYEILNRLYNEPDEWTDLDRLQASGVGVMALDMLDRTPRDDKGRGRGLFRLHPFSGTGCVVSDDLNSWGQMRDIVNNTRTQTVTDANGKERTLYGTMHVFSTVSPRAVFP